MVGPLQDDARLAPGAVGEQRADDDPPPLRGVKEFFEEQIIGILHVNRKRVGPVPVPWRPQKAELAEDVIGVCRAGS